MNRCRFLIVGVLGGVLFFSIAYAEEIRYDNANRRDPFQPLVGPHALQNEGTGKDAFPVEGVVYDPPAGSYAIIGGEIYREGDTVKDAQLIKIMPGRVILNQQSEEVVIWLREEILEPAHKRKKNDSK